jgi:hypothetical protein
MYQPGFAVYITLGVTRPTSLSTIAAMNKSQIQYYVNNFRRRLAPFLRPGIGVQCSIYPAIPGGAVLVFQLGPAVENDDVYKPESATLGKALSQIEQRAFGGNIESFHFGGTNTILEGDRLIFIKDGNADEWSDQVAAKDVRAVVPSQRGGSK